MKKKTMTMQEIENTIIAKGDKSMRVIAISIPDSEFSRFWLLKDKIDFNELVEKKNNE